MAHKILSTNTTGRFFTNGTSVVATNSATTILLPSLSSCKISKGVVCLNRTLPFTFCVRRRTTTKHGLNEQLHNSSSVFIFSMNETFLPSKALSFPLFPSCYLLPAHKTRTKYRRICTHTSIRDARSSSNNVVDMELEQEAQEEAEVEVAKGYTMTQFCDKMIDAFLNEKPRVKDWRKYLVFREEWKKYRESFYTRCRFRANQETDCTMKEKLVSLSAKLKKIDDEMEKHSDLLKEIQDNPTDLNAIVAKRRNDFDGEFFRYLILISKTYDGLEDQDGLARLGARCLSAINAFDKTLENVENFDAAKAKFNDILNSASIDVACEKIKSLAKAKELDSSLVLLINSAWARAKDSDTMKIEVKEIMYRLYKATKSSLRSIAPKELKLIKHLLNITDPEERFSALAVAFCPGDDHEAKDPYALYTTPKELHRWITIMLDSYHLSKEETDIREAKLMNQPMVMQRLFILKETIEEEYLEKTTFQTPKDPDSEKTTTDDSA